MKKKIRQFHSKSLVTIQGVKKQKRAHFHLCMYQKDDDIVLRSNSSRGAAVYSITPSND